MLDAATPVAIWHFWISLKEFWLSVGIKSLSIDINKLSEITPAKGALGSPDPR